MKFHYDRLQYLYSAICHKSLIYPGVVEDNAYFVYFFLNLIKVKKTKVFIFWFIKDNARVVYDR